MGKMEDKEGGLIVETEKSLRDLLSEVRKGKMSRGRKKERQKERRKEMKGCQSGGAQGISRLKGGCEEREFPPFLYIFSCICRRSLGKVCCLKQRSCPRDH